MLFGDKGECPQVKDNEVMTFILAPALRLLVEQFLPIKEIK